MSQAEVAAYFQSHLRNHKIHVTLSGGAGVSIYSVKRYVKADVDLVEGTYADRTQIKTSMQEIGFREKKSSQSEGKIEGFKMFLNRYNDDREKPRG